jgi:hypothetical protein
LTQPELAIDNHTVAWLHIPTDDSEITGRAAHGYSFRGRGAIGLNDEHKAALLTLDDGCRRND